MTDHAEIRSVERPSLHLDLAGTPVVYLIHLASPLRHARHYVGWSKNVRERIRIHRRELADSCSFMRAVNAAGIRWSTVRFWIGAGRDLERKIKNGVRAAYFCPICRRGYLDRCRDRMRRLRAARKHGVAA